MAEIIRAVEELEALNSIANPALSPLVSGKWSLLYTGAASLEAAKERAEKEGIIGSTVTEMTGSSSNRYESLLSVTRTGSLERGSLFGYRG